MNFIRIHLLLKKVLKYGIKNVMDLQCTYVSALKYNRPYRNYASDYKHI